MYRNTNDVFEVILKQCHMAQGYQYMSHYIVSGFSDSLISAWVLAIKSSTCWVTDSNKRMSEKLRAESFERGSVATEKTE